MWAGRSFGVKGLAASVCFVHEDTHFRFEAEALSACSDVLRDILAWDADGSEEHVLQMPDVSKGCILAFQKLVEFVYHREESAAVISIAAISELACAAMPLLHKYNCVALLRVVKAALNERPCTDGIVSYFAYYDEDVDWVGPRLLHHVACELRNRETAQHTLLTFPPLFVNRMFFYVLHEMTPTLASFGSKDRSRDPIPRYFSSMISKNIS